MKKPTRRQQYLDRLQALTVDQGPYRTAWQRLANNFDARRARFHKGDRNRDVVNDLIINSTPQWCVDVLGSGLMAGAINQAYPWFKLASPDITDHAQGEVKAYLHEAETVLYDLFARSNFYGTLSDGLIPDLTVLGTGVNFMADDPVEVLRCYPWVVGEYYLACSSRGRVDTAFREFQMPAGQVEQEFPWERLSQTTQQLLNQDKPDALVDVVHVIEPNPKHRPGSRQAGDMAWRSVWFERAAPVSETEERWLRESGFHEFPLLAARWSVRGNETYGRPNTLKCLADAERLQRLEERGAEVTEKMVRPPMQGPESSRGRVSIVPGAMNYIPDGYQGRIGPAIELSHLPMASQAAEDASRRRERRIMRLMFTDLFLAILGDERKEPATAEEIRARKEERLLQVGPVIERVNDEVLRPAIHRAFGIARRRGLIREPPAALRMAGGGYKVEFVSVLHRALKMMGAASMERGVSMLGNLAATIPGITRRLHPERFVDAYFDVIGAPPDILRTEAELAEVNAQEQSAQKLAAAQAGMGAAKEGAQAAQLLANTDLNGDTALNRMLATLGPQAAGGGFPPQGVGP